MSRPRKDNAKRENIKVRVEYEIKERLEEIATARCMSVSELLRELVQECLRNFPEK